MIYVGSFAFMLFSMYVYIWAGKQIHNYEYVYFISPNAYKYGFETTSNQREMRFSIASVRSFVTE